MRSYFALRTDGEADVLLAVDRSQDEMAYWRWDRDTAVWVEDSRLIAYLSGMGGSTDDVVALSSERATSLMLKSALTDVEAAGDKPGHEFHGNQWTSGVGVAALDAIPASEIMKGPGVRPIPEGSIRLFHYTSSRENLASIRDNGLLQSKSKGETYGEPNQVWASTSAPDVWSHAIVEFHVKPADIADNGPDEWRSPAEIKQWAAGDHNVSLKGSVPKGHIIAVHEPWHAAYRDLADSALNRKFLRDGSLAATNVGDEDAAKAITRWLQDHPEDRPTTTERAYSETQRRDYHGRWTGKGGGGSAEADNEAIFKQHPNLRPYGNKLHVTEADSAVVRLHLADLNIVPAYLHGIVAKHIEGIYVGNKAVPSLNTSGDLADKQPRGWPEGSTWKEVGGAYRPGKGDQGKVLIGHVKDDSVSASTALHEWGHAVDWAYGRGHSSNGSERLDFVGIHATLKPHLNEYFKQQAVRRKPNGLLELYDDVNAGRQELWAEATASYFKHGTVGPWTEVVGGSYTYKHRPSIGRSYERSSDPRVNPFDMPPVNYSPLQNSLFNFYANWKDK